MVLHKRHTHATMLLEAGANIKEIQKCLRHSRLATMMDTYSLISSKLKQDSVNRFESITK
ncbi:tyrosine-type recombinase/integrase [Clostridium aceticum]|uniref:tyrosine-type recombinase/integrase n=1 Tax=Clostridium aceticum TaxID=84022 RepID=UPI00311A38E0